MAARKKKPATFLGIVQDGSSLSRSRFVVLPVPYEATTSYGKGTAKGPGAIISASRHVETFDEEHLRDISTFGIHTLAPLRLGAASGRRAQDMIKAAVRELLRAGKVPAIIGGEHSVTPAAVSAAKEKYPDLSVLQIDAHADLRDSYMGDRLSHACVARRVLEICPVVQAGIRNISREEHDFAKSSGQLGRIHFAAGMDSGSVDRIAAQLSGNVYVTLDVDGLDPTLMPSTGTPEPGGLSWYDVLAILREVAARKNVVGFDVVEFSPVKGLHSPDFVVAKLVYKLMGYIASPLRA